MEGAAARRVKPPRGPIFPAETSAEFANCIEIAFEIGERKIAGGIVKTFFARFAGRANGKHTRLNRCTSVQAIVAADFKEPGIALAVIQIPFQRAGHGHNSGRAQDAGFFREWIRKTSRRDTFRAK